MPIKPGTLIYVKDWEEMFLYLSTREEAYAFSTFKIHSLLDLNGGKKEMVTFLKLEEIIKQDVIKIVKESNHD